MNQHMCEHEHCISIETQEYHNPDGTTEWLCFDHAIANGFCVWCQNFGAGEERFNFSEYHGGQRGYHPECWQEFAYETGEDEDDDPYNFTPYLEGWYDPDMDFENEESNGVDIGPGQRSPEFYEAMDNYFAEGKKGSEE